MNWLSEKIKEFSAAMIECIAANSSQTAFRSLGARRLVIRAIDDEAALVISAGAIGSRLSSLLLSFIGFLRILSPSILIGIPVAVLIIALLVYGLLAFPMTEVFMTLPGTTTREIVEFWAVAAVVTIGGSIAAVTSFLVLFFVASASLFRMAYGREMSLAGVNCEVSAHTAPDGSGVSVVTLRRAGERRGLRHFIHEHPQCAAVVFDWIELQLRT